MKNTLLLILAGALALLASCGRRGTEPEPPDPLELLYSMPAADTLFIGEQDSLVFMLRASGEGPLSAQASLEGVHLWDGDSLLLRAWEHVGEQLADPDGFLELEIRVSDGHDELRRTWALRILSGFSYFPEESDLSTVVDQSVMFQVGLATGSSDAAYTFFVDGEPAGLDSLFHFHAEEPGLFQVTGRIRLAEYEWLRQWNVTVEPGEPVDPPGVVTDLRAGPGSVPGNLAVAFRPPDDELREPAHRFEIRGHPFEVGDWESAYLIAIVESTPGAEEERFDLPALQAGLDLIIRVRSIGYTGNTSDWSERALARVAGYSVRGTVIDFETGEPVEGMWVRYGDVVVEVGADGSFLCDDVPELPAGGGGWGFPGLYFDETHGGLGEWFDLVDLRAVTDSVDYRMGSFRPEPFESDSYENFYEYFKTTVRPPPTNFHLIRPHYPLKTFIPEYQGSEIDYAAVCEQGMDIWESTTGLSFFERVMSPEEATLTFVFDDTTSVTGICEILEMDQETLTPLRQRITLQGGVEEEFAYGLYQVTFHELGHAIGFWIHSYDPDHCMNNSNQQDQPHPDEVRLARILYHMEPYEDLGFLRDGVAFD